MTNIQIDSLDTGYLITENANELGGKKHAAESADSAVRIIKRLLGIPELEPGWLIHLKKPAPAQAEGEVNEANLKTEPTKTGTPNILKSDLLIPRFKYDHSLRKEIPGYTSYWRAELSDGRAVMGYKGASYYTTKEKILQLPYPVPYGCLSGSGISSNGISCIRAYRHFLAAEPFSVEQAFNESLTKNEGSKKDSNVIDEAQKADYVSKSTQDRIKEKATAVPYIPADKALELRDARDKLFAEKLDQKRVKERQGMVIQMGVQ